jgi:hypothetical protein
MSITKNKDLAIKLDDIATATISSALIPVVTARGIQVGQYTVRPDKNFFKVCHKNYEHYKTYTKSAALIIAGMLAKDNSHKNVGRVIDADRLANSSRNDKEIFKYHYEIAVKNGDDIKKGIMSARYEIANENYREAKRILQESYSKLF